MTAILAKAGQGKTTTLLKLLDSESIFVTNEIENQTDEKRINLIYTNSYENVKDILEKCINDDKIKTIVVDSSALNQNDRNYGKLISFLKQSGKRIIIGMQVNKSATIDNIKNNWANTEISNLFELKVYREQC